MEKKYLSLLAGAIIIAMPIEAMQSIQRNRADEDCWTKVKYVAALCYAKCFRSRQNDARQESASQEEREQLIRRFVHQIEDSMPERGMRHRVSIQDDEGPILMAENIVPAFA